MNELLLILLAYLIGSIPTSVWVSKRFFNIDIRDYGSGNAGATNVYRVLGSRWGTFVMLMDMLKGVLAVQLAWLLPEYLDAEIQFQNLQTGLGMAAVLGHIFPIWAGFRGGKGVATILGNGNQKISWVHLEDLVLLFAYAIQSTELKGIYNAVSPVPVTNQELILTLAKLRRRYFVPIRVPAFLLQVVMGEMSVEVLKSTTVSAQKIMDTGFRFRYPLIQSALASFT